MVKRKLILLCALIIYATFVDGQSDEWVEGIGIFCIVRYFEEKH